MLLLLLSHFNHVQLCATPEMAAHQAPPPMGFSRQEYLSVQSLGEEDPLGGGHDNSSQYPCLENPMDIRAWRVTAHGVEKSRTRLKCLSTRAHGHSKEKQSHVPRLCGNEVKGTFVCFRFEDELCQVRCTCPWGRSWSKKAFEDTEG